ncbi:MAG TPA: DUF4395 domain-containing protein [Thermomicrobiales bacterium]|nr:DUF4395 domain-containing protein [Thermomicrobiales bacterium]
MSVMAEPAARARDGVPMPIVSLNRWVLLLGVLLALALGQPLITTALLAVMLPGVLFGPRLNPIVALGKRLFAARNQTAEREDRRLQRFNNAIAVSLLALSQLAFVAGLPMLGWTLSLMVAAAAAVALAGFCLGCFLYFQLKRVKYRLSSG